MIEPTNDGQDLISRPGTGALIGALAAGALLAGPVVWGGAGRGAAWLAGLAAMMLPRSFEAIGPHLWLGLGVHLALGALLGALHSACQRRTTRGGMLAVGLFYGLILWIGGSMFLVHLLGIGPPQLARWSTLAYALGYGVMLASWTIAQAGRAGIAPVPAPLD